MNDQRVELIDEGAPASAETHAVLSRKGFPRWLLVIPLGLIAALLILTTDNSPARQEAEPDGLASTTTEGALPEEVPRGTFGPGSRIFGTEPERLGLVHGLFAYTTTVPLKDPHVVAIRSGANLMVIDSTELLAHRIRLPLGSSTEEPDPHTLAIVADKLIVSDEGLLRSLSVSGGVDVLLANDLVGFEVNNGRLLVAAQISDNRFTDAKQTELRVQGVHADFFGVPGQRVLPDAATVRWLGRRLFIERGGQVLVPTGDAFISLGSGTVLAAGANHALIQRCGQLDRSQELDCELLRSRLDGNEQIQVPGLEAIGKGSLVISPVGDQVFVVQDGSDQQSLLTLSGDRWRESLVIEGPAVSAAAFSADGQTLALARGNLVQFWEAGEIVGAWQIDGFDTITEITFNS